MSFLGGYKKDAARGAH